VTVILVLVGSYAVLLTAIVIVSMKPRRNGDEVSECVEKWFSTQPVTQESVTALSAFKTAQQSALPWFERSISTVGVVSFLAMSIATAVQTVQGMNAELDTKLLRAEIADLQKQKEAATHVINSSVRALREVLALRDSVDPGVRTLLQFHLQQVVASGQLTIADAREAFGVAVAIGEYETAGMLFRKWPDLATASTSEEQLVLAEGLYLIGQPQRSREVMRQVSKLQSTLPNGSQRRAIRLDAVLNPGGKQVAALAALLNLSLDDAQRVLESEAARLRATPTLVGPIAR
jgi:hypothetical protein